MSDFSQVLTQPALIQAVQALGYEKMTPIQAGALPPMLAGKDVIAQARTGSGKTVAFGLALLARIDPGQIRAQALVLCPTRELADQVAKELRRLARFVPNVKLATLCGGIPLRPQIASLTHEPHIVVGTPGRIEELLEQGYLKFDAIEVLVLDEADRMLDMGFEESVNAVVAATSVLRQTLLFSATYPESIRAVSQRLQRHPVEVTVDTEHRDDEIEQQFFEVDASRKLDAVVNLLALHRPESAIVFCNTRRDVQDVTEQLEKRGFYALALHGDLEQRERDEVLLRFANRSCTVLVATDVAARGLDIKELGAVVSYELPTDPDIHVHRIGRSGRAGQKGLALNLVSSKEMGRTAAIEERAKAPLRWAGLKLSDRAERAPARAPMATLCIDGGRKDKLRPADILGALTGTAGMAGDAIGKIDIFDTRAYVAVKAEFVEKAFERLRAGKIKGRTFRVRRIG
ncbi:MAG: ATP-dependent RNA helicase DbpA [Tahibacter sp.]